MALQWNAESQEALQRLEGRYVTDRAKTLPVLWIAQKQFNHISNEVAALVAETVGTSVREVQEVVSFYVLFHDNKVGEHVIWMCRNLSCVLRGFSEIKVELEKQLGIKTGETTADGAFTLLENECLGACGGAPMIQIDERFYEDLTPESIKPLLDRVRKGEVD